MVAGYPSISGPGKWGECGTDCPIYPDIWTTDDTLKVTHHKLGQKETLIPVKLCAILSFSLLLIALMVKVLGIYLVLKY